LGVAQFGRAVVHSSSDGLRASTDDPVHSGELLIRPDPTPNANIELIRTSFEEFNAGDLDACMAHLARTS
jgi:hypothetical protein